MGLIAKDTSNGADFKPVPTGAHIGRCIAVIDMGTQRSVGQFGESMVHKIQIRWEVFGEDENGLPLTVVYDGKTMPMTVRKTYTLSLHEKAALRRDLQAWRGKAFTDEEALGFDVSKLLGQYCLINVTHSESGGKTYANVSGLTPVPAAMRANKPAGVHPLIMFDLDNPNMDVFNSFHEKLQEAIKASPEWQARTKPAAPAVAANVEDDDIPF